MCAYQKQKSFEYLEGNPLYKKKQLSFLVISECYSPALSKQLIAVFLLIK